MRTANWPTVYLISPPAQSYMKVMASSSILMGHQRRHREHTSIKHLSGNWWPCCGLIQSLFGCLLHTLLQQSTSHRQHAQKETPELSLFLLGKLVWSCYVPAAALTYWTDLQPEPPKGQQERFCNNTASQQWFIIHINFGTPFRINHRDFLNLLFLHSNNNNNYTHSFQSHIYKISSF